MLNELQYAKLLVLFMRSNALANQTALSISELANAGGIKAIEKAKIASFALRMANPLLINAILSTIRKLVLPERVLNEPT